jgi:large subunit ribosomal protein L15
MKTFHRSLCLLFFFLHFPCSFLSAFLFFFSKEAYAFVARSSSSNHRVLLKNSVSNGSTTFMKIYDWKRRTATESEAILNDIENTKFTLDNLRSAPGARKRITRKGRGISAGQGASCGFGMRGQKSRSGRPTRPGFEGGQTPLYRRLPKIAGKAMGPGHDKIMYNIISTDVLVSQLNGSTITYPSLLEKGVVTKTKHTRHKFVLGKSGQVPASNLIVQAHAFTQSARAMVESVGGKCELLSPTTNQVIMTDIVES